MVLAGTGEVMGEREVLMSWDLLLTRQGPSGTGGYPRGLLHGARPGRCVAGLETVGEDKDVTNPVDRITNVQA